MSVFCSITALVSIAAASLEAEVPLAPQVAQSGLNAVDLAMDAADVLWPHINRDRLVEKSLDTTIRQTFDAQNIFREINTRYPKADAAAKVALRPLFFSNSEKRIQQHLSEMAKFYRSNFANAELEQLLHFWQSTTGEKLLRATTSGEEFDALVKSMGNGAIIGEQPKVTGQSTDQAQSVAAKAIDSLSDAEVKDYLEFSQSKVGRKYRSLAVQRIALQFDWANKRSPEFEREAAKTLIRAVNAHIETFPKRAGEVHIRLTEPM